MMMRDDSYSRPGSIAIIGMAGRFPGAPTLDQFWRNIEEGVESITFFSDEELLKAGVDPELVHHPNYVGAVPVLEGIDLFDAGLFQYSRREASLIDPQQRLFLECAREGLEGSGHLSNPTGASIGIFAGSGGVMTSYLISESHVNQKLVGPTASVEHIGNDKDFLCTRVSYKLNLHGPSITVQTACSTSLVAVHVACQSLLAGECDIAIAGGVTIRVPHYAGYLHHEGGLLSPDGHCRAFDELAQGTTFGSGVGLVVLRPLHAALENGDIIHAVVRGSAVSNDGAHKTSYWSTKADGQIAAINEALSVAEVDPETIELVEAHGTGTPLGDSVEVIALTKAYRSYTQKRSYCAIGSVKSNIGHLEAAAGIAGLLKAVLALKHKKIPPTINLTRPNPRIDFPSTPFYVAVEGRSWDANPRRAAVNSLGVGGTNAHVILEEAPPLASRGSDDPHRPQLLTLSTHAPRSLHELALGFREYLSSSRRGSFANICFTANTGRIAYQHRLALTADSTEGAVEKLDAFLTDRPLEGVFKGAPDTAFPPTVAFLFTGQGAQYPNMGSALYETQPTFRHNLDRCAEILDPLLDHPLLSILFSSSEAHSLIHQTMYTQPALFALEYSLVELWKSWGVQPDVLLGHSLGEYVAACIAGVFSLEDGLRFVVERARLMNTLPQGPAMAAVMTHLRRIENAIDHVGGGLSISAINGPDNVVIAGATDRIERTLEYLGSQQVSFRRLTVSHAFHSHLLEPILEEFKGIAEKIRYARPKIPIVSNVTGKLCDPDEVATARYWVKHLRSTVQFWQAMETLHQQGHQNFLEIGPKPTLLALGRWCLPKNHGTWLPSLCPPMDDLTQMLKSLGHLFTQGFQIDWIGFHRDTHRRRVELPTMPLQRERYWINPSSNKEILDPTHHPLLGRRLTLPFSKDVRFEWRPYGQVLQDLNDHRLFGEVVAPAAYYASLLCAAAKELWGVDSCTIHDFVFHRALVFNENAPPTYQLVLVPTSDRAFSFKFIAQPPQADAQDERSWMIYVEGRLEAPPPAQFSVDPVPSLIAGTRDELDTVLSGSQMYADLSVCGYGLGQAFRWIGEVFTHENEMIARLDKPYDDAKTRHYPIHPGLLDSCYQLMLVNDIQRMKREEGLICVPFEIASIAVFGSPQTEGPYFCSVTTDTDKSMTGSIQLIETTSHGESVLLRVEGLVARVASRPQLLGGLKTARSDWIYWEEWEKKEQLRIIKEATTTGHWIILADEGRMSERLAAAIFNKGDSCSLVYPGQSFETGEDGHFHINPEQPQDFSRLLNALGFDNMEGQSASRVQSGEARARTSLSGIVYMWSLSGESMESGATALSKHAQALGCGGVLHMIQAISGISWKTAPRLVIVTQGAKAINGNKKKVPLHLEQAPLWGLNRVIALEHPELNCLSVDLGPTDSPDQINALCQELLCPDHESYVGFRNGTRYTGRLVRSTATSATEFFPREDGTYLIAGGLGALGIEVAQWLVKKGVKHLVLIGRKLTTASEPLGKIVKQLENHGTDLRMLACDISSYEDLRQVLSDIEKDMPPLRGVFHLAGVLRDGTLVKLDWDRFYTVMEPKLVGAWNLHTLTRDLPLDCFVFFSSIASLFGTSGQGNYAAANAFMDALAHYRQALGLPGLSINWGPWAETGMAAGFDPQIRQRFEKRGLGMIDPREGLDLLGHCLGLVVAQVGVQPVNWSKLLNHVSGASIPFFERFRQSYPHTAATWSTPADHISYTVPPPLPDSLQDHISNLITEILGLDDKRLEPCTNLFDIGFDSLSSIELRNQLRERLGVYLPYSFVFDCPTVETMAEYLSQHQLKDRPCFTPNGKVEAPEPPPSANESILTPLMPSHGQSSLWLLHQLNPNDPAYNMAFVTRAVGYLDIDALARACQRLAKRHRSLRLTFDAPQGVPWMVFQDVLPPVFSVFDGEGLPPHALHEAILSFHRQPFDLAKGPLLRIGIFKLGPDEHVLVATMHHIIGDFSSLEIVIRELERFYSTEIGTFHPAEDPEDSRDYMDFLRQEEQYISGAQGEASRSYWQAQLAEPPPAFIWPFSDPCDETGGDSTFFSLGNELTKEVRAFAVQQNTTLYSVFLAAWAELIARYTGQRDCFIGAPVSTRDASFASTIGYFINTLPMRLKADPDKRFRELVIEARHSLTEALEHRLFPFPLIVDAIHAPREEGRNPLYQTVVAFQQPKYFRDWANLYLTETTDSVQIDWAGLSLTPWRLPQQEGQVDILLEIVEADDGLRCVVKTQKVVVSSDLMRQIASRFPVLLRNAVQYPDTPLAELRIMDDGEERTVTNALNPESLMDFPDDDFIRRFKRVVERSGSKQAVTDGRISFSYAELDSRSAAIAAYLLESGVRCGDRVAACFAPSADAVLGMLSIMRAGASYVPIDPHMPEERVAQITSIGHISHALVDRNLSTPFPSSVKQATTADILPIKHPFVEQDAPGARDIAYTVFTSGSTGEPKGVDVLHGSLVSLLDAMVEVIDIAANDRWTWFHAASFDFSIWEIWGALGFGGTLVVVPGETRARPDAFVDLLAREKVTLVAQTPTALRLLADELDRRSETDLHVRHLVICGEALPGELARRLLDRDLTMWNLYGVAEATVFTTVERIDARSAALETVSIGHPLRFATVQIMDEKQRPVPPYVMGELCIGGPGVSGGYVGLPELNAAKFLPDPEHGDYAKLYRTGDLAMWDGKCLHFRGRRDGMVKVRGYRVELREIEIVLRTHEAISDVAVITEKNEHSRELVALLVKAAAVPKPSDRALRDHVARRLPHYMIPARFMFVPQLTVNAHHKLDRKSLNELVRAAGERAAERAASRQEDPSDLMTELSKIWCKVLHLDAVGPDDVFFDLGGTSLSIMRVFAEVTKLRGVSELSPSDLFRYPTLRALSRYLQGDQAPIKVASVQEGGHTREAEGRDHAHKERVAIIGINIRVPGAGNADSFWSNLVSGRVSLRRLDPAELRRLGVAPEVLENPNYVPVDTTIEDSSLFDPDFFGYSQREAELSDPQHRLLLETAWELLESIGYNGHRMPRIGVFAGCSMNTYLINVLQRKRCDLASLIGTELMLTNDKDYMTSRVSYTLGLNGPSIVVQTGCSSSLVAVHLAVQSLLSGECDIALAGGVSVHVSPQPGYLYEPDLMFSPDGVCRAFDKNADGTPFADGVGMVALRRLDKALDEGDRIKAVILGTSSNNDGASKAGFTAPGVAGQRELIKLAQAQAGVHPDEIGYIEAHGTGTRLGDLIEVSAINEVFREKTQRVGFCALGSVKANIGHLAAASGIAGLAKTVLALEHGLVPPHPTFAEPNPELHFGETPFFINTSAIPWPISGPRRAGVSSFGVGGSNVHVILEQPPPQRYGTVSCTWQIAPLSARTAKALDSLSEQTARALEADPNLSAEDIAATLQMGRRNYSVRRVHFGRNVQELVSGLRQYPDTSINSDLSDVCVVLVVEEDMAVDWLMPPEVPVRIAINRHLDMLRDRFDLNMDFEDVVSNNSESPGSRNDIVGRFVAILSGLSLWLRLVDGPSRILAKGVGALASACASGTLTVEEAVASLISGSENTTDAMSEVNVNRSDLIISLGAPGVLMESVQAAARRVGAASPISPDSDQKSSANGPGWFLRTVADLWRRGVDIRWEALHEGSVIRRVPLPSHPLNRRRCWWKENESSESIKSSLDPKDWLYAESWNRSGHADEKRSSPLDGPVLLFEDSFGLGAKVTAILRQGGVQVISVRCADSSGRFNGGYLLNASRPNAGQDLGHMLREDAVQPRGIAHFWGMDADHTAPVFKQLALGLYTILDLAKELPADVNEPIAIDIINTQMFNVCGDDVVEASHCAILGAIHVLPQEMPWLRVRAIDVGTVQKEDLEVHASELYGELLTPSSETVLALRHGYRWRRSFEKLSTRGKRLHLSPGGLCLVTGGLGEVGLALADRFARVYGVSLLLISRSGAPPREEWERILEREGPNGQTASRVARLLEMEKAGISMHIVAADVTDRDQMKRAIAQGEAHYGKVTAFIHCAGLSGADIVQWIHQSSRPDWEKVLRPKITGAQILHQLLEASHLELGYFVSSLAVVAGGLGFAAYAAANSYLDGFAQQYRGKAAYLAVDWEGWTTWENGDPNQLATPQFKKRESWALSPEEAVEANDYALDFVKEARVLISRVPPDIRFEQVRMVPPDPLRSVWPESGLELMGDPASSLDSIEQKVFDIWSRLLRCTVSLDANFFDLGGNSLLAIELIQQVNKAFGSSLKPPDLFGAPTIKEMAILLSGNSPEEETRGDGRRRARRQRPRKRRTRSVK